METGLHEVQGLRVAVEGCCHGTLYAIYAAIGKACEVRGWDKVDLLIIGGDFQAVRNANDLTVMSCPVKYHAIGDFHAYYSGTIKAPYLTIFIGGNHEASSHMWELYYGGWAAPNIYYMGATNVIRVGGIRIVGMSGIWKGYNYNKVHYERLPYNQDDIKSIYHIRELDVRKLLQLQTQVDIGISHDWPKAIEKDGDFKALFRAKDMFEKESRDGTLGSTAAAYVMDRLRPPYWFAAHMHIKFAATKIYQDAESPKPDPAPTSRPLISSSIPREEPSRSVNGSVLAHNSDEIDLDMDDDEDDNLSSLPTVAKETPAISNTDEISLDDDDEEESPNTPVVLPPVSALVPDDIRARLPAAFSRPPPIQRTQPGQPVPTGITNKTVRFLALDKCLPSRKFLQLLEIEAYKDQITPESRPPLEASPEPKFEYDPEWLAITRAFASDVLLGDKNTRPSLDKGEAAYTALIEKELHWVQENIVKKDKLDIPYNFELTAHTFDVGSPEIVQEGPVEYNNPQTQQFCDLVGIKNQFFATDEERTERMKQGPAEADPRFDNRRGGRGGGGGGGGRGRSWGNRGGRGKGRGRAW